MGERENMNEYYKEKLGEGLHFQDFVVEELYKIGLPIISYSSKEYQNMIGENKAANPNYIPSGIYRSDNTWLYLIGDYEKIYIFAKSFLVQLHSCGRYREIEIPLKTSKGYLLPGEDAVKYCAKIILPEK